MHFIVGLSMESTDNALMSFVHPVKLFFIKNYLRFDEDKFTSASFMIEGDDKTVEWKSSCLRKIANKYGGFYTGENVAKLSYTASSSYSIYLRVSSNVIKSYFSRVFLRFYYRNFI